MKRLIKIFALLICTTMFGQLKIGETAPSFSGFDQAQNSVSLDQQLNKYDKVLLVFYRGNWCGYCKKYLVGIQSKLEQLKNKGIGVIVVTPEQKEFVSKTAKETEVAFPILHDSENKIMTNYKVIYDVTPDNIPKYFTAVIKKVYDHNGVNNPVLPVPATYLINKNKKVEFVHYDKDYSKRADIEEILSSL